MKKVILLFAVLLLLLLNGCEEGNPTEYLNLIPKITISSPSTNSNVSDTVLIKIDVRLSGLLRVELYIDHSIPYGGVFEEPPYVYQWDTRYFGDGSQHILQAKAYDASGNSISSKYVIVNVYRFMPSNLNASIVSDSLIELNWIDNSNFEIGFEIEQKLNDSDFVKIAEVDSNITAYSVQAAINLEDIYYFRVRAKSKSEFSSYSNIASAQVLLHPPDNLNIQFTSDSSAIFSWNDNNDFETDYVIQKLIANYGYTTVKVVSANTTFTTILDIFKSNQIYNYIIFAKMNDMFGQPSNFPYTSLKFPPPQNLKAENIDPNSLKLEWEDVNNFELEYIIEKRDDGLLFTEIGEVNANSTSFIDNNLDTSNIYTYRVFARSRINQSAPSENLKVRYLPNIQIYKQYPVSSSISWMTVSNDASIIAFGGYLSNRVAVFIYDTFTGLKLKTLQSVDINDRIFEEIALSPNNKYVAATGDNQTVTIWDINSESVVARVNLRYHTQALAFSPDGNYLLAESGGTVRFYDVSTWQFVSRIFEQNYIYDIAISPDQSIIATSEEQSVIKLWDFNSGSKIIELPSSNGFYNLKFNKTGTRLYANNTADLLSWDVSSGTIYNRITQFGYMRSFDINEDIDLAAGSYGFSGITLWLLSENVHIIDNSNEDIFPRIHFTSDNKYLIGQFYPSSYYIWELKKEWVSPIQ